MHGYKIIKDDYDLFKGALFTEQDITSPETSLSRLVAYAMLGGAWSSAFDALIRRFIVKFKMRSFTFTPDAKQLRYFRTVLEVPVEVGQTISLD